GDFYTRVNCDELAAMFTRKLQLQQDYLISVEPTGRSASNLAADLDRIMRKFSAWWGKRHRTGPDGEPSWLNYFLVAVPWEANHASHAHIVLSEYLGPEEEQELIRRAA